MICKKHNTEMRIRWAHEGTPRQDFDGFYCPECEAEKKARVEAYRAENAHWLRLVDEAEELRKAIKRRAPYEGFLEQKGAEAYDRWFAKALAKWM